MPTPPAVYEVTVAEALTQCLRREGIERVFGLPGSFLLPLLDAFHRGGLKNVESRHEGAAAFMAAAYGMASGQVGVVHTASGPGTTNALTGVAGAFADSVPLLLIMSQIMRARFGTDFHQESSGAIRAVDQMDIFRSVSYYNARPPVADVAVAMMRMALRQAIGRRGPTCYELPFDLQWAKVRTEDMSPASYRSMSTPVDVAGVESVCRMLKDAKAPVLVIGDALTHVGASAELTSFCEEQQIPCATVNYTKGVIAEDHPLALGVCGEYGQGAANEYLEHADLIITMGVRMGPRHTGWFGRKMCDGLVQIDDDPQEIGRNLPVRLGVLGDVPATLRAMRAAMRGMTHTRSLEDRVAALREKHQVYAHPDSLTDSDPLTAPRLLRVAREVLPRDALVVGDTGSAMSELSTHFPVYAPDGFFALYTLASMGSSLPMSLGVQLARPEATVLNVIGDGSFLLYEGELNVAVQHELPVITLVLNNGLYKSVSDRQLAWFNRTYATTVPSSKYSEIGKAHGCDGYFVRTAEEARVAVTAAVKARRPTVIEAVVDPHYGKVTASSVKLARTFMPTIPEGWPFLT